MGTLKKVKELKVLDGKTAQNILILLNGSLKHMRYDDIKLCLLRCDDKILSESVLEQLIQVRYILCAKLEFLPFVVFSIYHLPIS